MVADLSDFALSSAFDGYNACVFSYGASGSGKSLVMYGTQSTKGLIQMVCEGLFTKAVSYEDDTSFRAEVRSVLCTAVHILNLLYYNIILMYFNTYCNCKLF